MLKWVRAGDSFEAPVYNLDFFAQKQRIYILVILSSFEEER